MNWIQIYVAMSHLQCITGEHVAPVAGGLPMIRAFFEGACTVAVDLARQVGGVWGFAQ